ncbi:hypothetical protein [Nocardioides sp.]|uniref:hypothetical protein n=1 Tax=Nocardioides sp. TaxID=35761 RepID=UPI003782F5F5
MVVWIIVGVVVVALAVFAFWPRKRGIVDGEVRQSRRRDQGVVEPYDNPNIGGGI